MIPQVQDDLKQDFTFTTLPSRTFKMRHDTKTITGTIDEVRAVEQAAVSYTHLDVYKRQAQGDTKKSVVVTDCVTPVNAMAQLYMTVYVQ